jgi:hypothetical protein
MDQPKTNVITSAHGARAEQHRFCRDDDEGDDATCDTGMVPPIAVLARIPNLGSGASEAAAQGSVGTYRLLSQSLSFRLLTGTTILLMIVAIASHVISKARSTSGSSTASGQRATWQPEVPAPTADTAPAWTPPVAIVQTGKPEGNVPRAASGTYDAMPGNPGPTTGGPQIASAARVDNAGPTATANAPVRIAEAASASEQGPLTWKNFSRRYDEQRAPSSAPLAPKGTSVAIAARPDASYPKPPMSRANAQETQSNANRSTALNQGMTRAIDRSAPPSTSAAANVPHADVALPSYPTTNTPDPLTVGPSIASPSGNDQPVYSYRKQP